MTFFSEVVFPPLIKKEVLYLPLPSKVEERNLMFETLFCNQQGSWISVLRCLKCDIRKKSIEEILRLDE